MHETPPPQPPSSPPTKPPPSPPPSRTDLDTFKLVSDTVVGPNLRLKDNLYQALAILLCMVLGAGAGFALLPIDGIAGALIGGFIGLVMGFFGSGIFLMIYRGVRHVKGRHD